MGNKKITSWIFWFLLLMSITVFLYNLIDNFDLSIKNNAMSTISVFLTFLIYSSLIKLINDDKKYKKFFINQFWKELEHLSNLLQYFKDNTHVDRGFNLLSRKINNNIGILAKMKNRKVNGDIIKLKEEINELVIYASDNIHNVEKVDHNYNLNRKLDNIELKINEIIIKIYE